MTPQNAAARRSILNEDPAGRLDVLTLRAAKLLADRMNAGQVWDRGLGALVEECIVRTVPGQPMSAIDVLDRLGLLPPDRRNKGARRP